MIDINPEDHDEVIKQLSSAQNTDDDNREAAAEAKLFLCKRNGQWEPTWWEANSGKPRYTFDLTTQIVNQIHGKIREADFAGDISPAGGEASEDEAEILNGMVRNIQAMSKADHIYSASARSMIISGIDGWRVVQKYSDDDSFEQDLYIENIENFSERVWFDVGAEKQDMSDANYCWVFTAFTPEEYKEKWPDGSGESLGDPKTTNAYFNQGDKVMVGEFYYIKKKKRELALMSNGKVYEINKDYKKIKDELAEVGITEIRTRTRMKSEVYVRFMDGKGWLDDSRETIFKSLPVVPVFGNFQIFENKVLYHGAVEKRLDPQRVLNYSLSREIEEGALAPRAKYWMTPKQASGHENTLATLNTNADPVQFYNPDAEAPGQPQQAGGANINPGLRMISDSMIGLIPQTAGLFAPNLGDNPNAQSGVAIKRLQERGDVGSYEYFEAMEIAIGRTMKILVEAIPEVYKEGRQVRTVGDDGSYNMVDIQETIIDNDTGEQVVINDLSKGTYNVLCSAGPSFQNRQEETVAAITEIAAIDPSIIQMGADILLDNISAPGMKTLASRKRQQLIAQGIIPLEQLTDEERAEMEQQAAQQAPAPDPMMVMAEAEMAKAQAAGAKVELDRQEAEINIQEKGQKLQLAARKEDREDFKVQNQSQNDQMNMMMAQQTQIVDALNTQAQTLKLLREAMGADQIVSPGGVMAYEKQAGLVGQTQDTLEKEYLYNPADGSMERVR